MLFFYALFCSFTVVFSYSISWIQKLKHFKTFVFFLISQFKAFLDSRIVTRYYIKIVDGVQYNHASFFLDKKRSPPYCYMPLLLVNCVQKNVRVTILTDKITRFLEKIYSAFFWYDFTGKRNQRFTFLLTSFHLYTYHSEFYE